MILHTKLHWRVTCGQLVKHLTCGPKVPDLNSTWPIQPKADLTLLVKQQVEIIKHLCLCLFYLPVKVMKSWARTRNRRLEMRLGRDQGGNLGMRLGKDQEQEAGNEAGQGPGAGTWE